MLTKQNNPFRSSNVDDTVTLPPGNVPELHANVIERVESLLKQSREAGIGIGLLVIGQTGSGKSHMIAQLRRQLAGDPGVVPVAIRMRGAYTGRFWSHTRKELVSELLRGYDDVSAGANGLLRILRNRFPKWAAKAGGSGGGLFDWMFGGTKSSNGDLKPFLDEHHRTSPVDYQLDYNLRKVLPKVGEPELTTLAHDWLKGDQLGADDLQALGLNAHTNSDQEVESREVVASLLKLAGTATTLLVCFDEVETIQAGAFDATALGQFTKLVTQLVVQTGPRLVATFLRSSLHAEIVRAAAETHLQSNLDKMGQVSATIPTLTWEQTVRIVACRLEASKACHDARQLHPGDQFWPLSKAFVESTFQQHKLVLSPRHLILACAVEFDRVVSGGPPYETGKPVTTTNGAGQGATGKVVQQSDSDEFLMVWKKRVKRVKPQAVKFDGLMGIALPWLAELTACPFTRMHEVYPQLGDIDLLFRPTAPGALPVGVSFCNHEPKSLRWRLERVQKQWDGVRGRLLGGVVLLRYSEPKITAAAQERVNKLTQAGARALFLSTQQLTELTAFYEMFVAAQTGELTRKGSPVDVSEYGAWAKGNITDAVKEFLGQVFHHQASSAPAAARPVPAPAPAAVRGTVAKRPGAAAQPKK